MSPATGDAPRRALSGRIFVGGLLLFALVFGIAMYWSKVYAYYYTVAATDPAAVMRMVSVATGEPEEIIVENFEGIDASSSPIRFRACFTTPTSIATLTETYVVATNATPLVGPPWFKCYDAGEITNALRTGEAVAFLSEEDIHPGVDRLIAVFPDGRAFAWQQAEPDGEFE